jgi:hypothetical protein
VKAQSASAQACQEVSREEVWSRSTRICDPQLASVVRPDEFDKSRRSILWRSLLASSSWATAAVCGVDRELQDVVIRQNYMNLESTRIFTDQPNGGELTRSAARG